MMDAPGAGQDDRLIQLHAVSKTFQTGPDTVYAVREASLTLRAGEFIILQGPSGSGKTTLLSIMGCMMKPSQGRVWVRGREVTTLGEDVLPLIRRKHIGFIFQTYNLFDALTAMENVSLALKIRGFPFRERRRESRRMLERVGLGECMNRRPGELSGGQRQRVSIARALAGGTDVILADEPTAALDTATGLGIVGMLKEETLANGKAALVVTHDPRLERFATRMDHIVDGVLTLGKGMESGGG